MHVTYKGEKRNAYKMLCGKLKRRGQSEDTNVHVRIILKVVLRLVVCELNSAGFA